MLKESGVANVAVTLVYSKRVSYFFASVAVTYRLIAIMMMIDVIVCFILGERPSIANPDGRAMVVTELRLWLS